MKLSTFSPALVGASILFSLSTHAALVGYDMDGTASSFEIVYDTVLDISWLADANLAASNTFGVNWLGINPNGTMSWNAAEVFVANMNADGGTGYLGVNTWRQPTVAPVSTFTSWTYDGSSDFGYQLSAPIDATYNPNGQSPGFTGSELAYHYYNNFEAIGACYGSGTTSSGCQSSSVYGIDDAPDTQGNKALFSNIINSNYWTGTEFISSGAFDFHTTNGSQGPRSKSIDGYVWAVADGNVAANAVPVPGAVWLFGSGLAGLVVIRKRR